MGKRVQTYAVVCVTIDCETDKVVDLELSDASEMPMEECDVWDIDSQAWVTPDDPFIVKDWADSAVATALAASEQAVKTRRDLIEAAKEALKCIEKHVPATEFAPREWLRDAITKAEEA